MDAHTTKRLGELLNAIDAGTSPLTNQDVTEAFTMAIFPSDAPSVAPNPVVAMQRDVADYAGHQLGAVSYDVILATLEDRLRKKNEGR